VPGVTTYLTILLGSLISLTALVSFPPPLKEVFRSCRLCGVVNRSSSGEKEVTEPDLTAFNKIEIKRWSPLSSSAL